jgi:hypothetical protein
MSSWNVSYQTNTVFSTYLLKTDDWVSMYDWCNHTFNAEYWHFWYEAVNDNTILVFFEFLNENNALEFQEQWTV